MKKSLIALAVLAASGATMAQSSVTVYGRVDASVGSIDKIVGGSDTKLFSGGDVGLTTPRLGFMGVEDLGGGLKATFKLEQRINLDTGDLQTPSFKGETSVGLSGGFGAVRLGRMTTSFDDARAVSNKFNVFDSNGFTPTGAVLKTSSDPKTKNSDYSSRANGMVRYDSPSFGGVYGSFSHAFEQTAGADDTVTSLMLGYKDGGLNVALGFQDEKTKQEYTQLAASYDFGSFALSGGYSTRKADAAANGKDTEYNLGVEVPFGAVKVSAGYASSETKISGAKANESSGFGLGAKYALSKRTSLYGGYSKVSEENAAGVKSADTKIFAVGVRHDF
ncbi:porin [Hydrogenophaga sp.]|uniref:porin n=1 Tax=Hydrogenophaga sp. TaxID=1904254 RepID=UPI00286E47DB|nr:porin [Hydrogenophaga sp.]